MQIAHVEVLPVQLSLKVPYRVAAQPEVSGIEAVFVRIETRGGQVAWGCAPLSPALTPEAREHELRAFDACAERAMDLNPLNTEFALAEILMLSENAPAARCAFDVAFYDLLGLATGLPLHRLLGGYRYRIQTSITLSLAPVKQTVEMAHRRAAQGFRIIKLKGGQDPDEDVQRVKAVARALPNIPLRLDAEQGYTVKQALEVASALEDRLEMLEQPTPADDLQALAEVTRNTSMPILADESLTDPASALVLAGQRAADGMSIKLSTCGGLHCGRQIDAIARAARMSTMVGCVNEPALLIAAGLGLALSSPNVQYGDLDGHFDLVDDPTRSGFAFEDGWLVARDVPGLGCTVEL